MSDLRTQFGQIDIYLFDQLLRGRIRPGMRVLEAGCGSGRNLTYFIQAGYEVAAVDYDQMPGASGPEKRRERYDREGEKRGPRHRA